MGAHSLEACPIHLGLGATAKAQPPFTGLEWYADYVARHASDGAEGRLVSLHRFTGDWDVWEMHPSGDEVVVCLSGTLVLHQEHPDQQTDRVVLAPGEYAINPPGVWHTADISGEVSCLFITAGLGTQHRSR